MSAAVYSVEVLDRKGRIVRLRLYIVHPDEHDFCLARNCALQILWDQVNPSHHIESRLGEAMSEENRLDPYWVVVNERRFIKRVKLIETKNHPVPEDFSFGKHLKKKSGLPQAVVEIEAADEKWVEHIKKGQTWDTAPYDMEFYI